MNIFITYLWKDPQLFFAVTIVVIFSICCHEFMHAWVALKNGDPTAAENGHLTFNPFKQMGIMSLILLALFGLAWGAVPVNRANLKSKSAAVMVAISGPLTNLVLSQLFILLCFAVALAGIDNRFAISMLVYGSALNLLLTLLNLMPIPGLDGWNVITELFPKLLTGSSETVKGSYFMLIVLFFVFFNRIFDFCQAVAISELYFLASLVN